jgi:hypothetical protein
MKTQEINKEIFEITETRRISYKIANNIEVDVTICETFLPRRSYHRGRVGQDGWCTTLR